MFTIKLYSSPDSYDVITTSHYNIYFNDKSKVTELTVYKDFSTQYGVTYRICNRELEVPHRKYAFIENSSGKTIDHIK